MKSSAVLTTAVDLIKAPLFHKGKVRELYDLGESYLIVVTDRISAFDYVLRPAVPEKGKLLNQLSRFWFEKTAHFQPNHVVHTDVGLLEHVALDPVLTKDRMMIVRKAERIDIECVVRGYITGSAWRQYRETGRVNGNELPRGLRKNERLPTPIFTPAAKNDVGHDEDLTLAQLEESVGAETARGLKERSLRLYAYAHEHCEQRGVILADTKFEFGIVKGEIVLIDEMCTPDSSRFWAKEKYALDIEIDSMDKEPVRTYLAQSGWDRHSEPDPLPPCLVEATSLRYQEIYHRLTR